MAGIEMMIDSIRVASKSSNRNLVLKEKLADRYLPIWIGNAEADAIGIKLQAVQCTRPLTHDFLCAVIEALGATVKSAVIDKLQGDTFYAKVTLITNRGEIDVDCRPSDAIAVAVRAEAPVFADKDVLDRAGIAIKGGE